MNTDIKTINTLHDLLHYDARKFTYGEILLQDQLAKWVVKATSLKLKLCLQKYQVFVDQHIKKLENFFVEENINSLSVSNYVIKAFIKELEEKLYECNDAEVGDACILAGVQAINHFKISIYGTAAAFAKETGNDKYAGIFHEAEVNEKQIDDRLSQLAEHEINAVAKARIGL